MRVVSVAAGHSPHAGGLCSRSELLSNDSTRVVSLLSSPLDRYAGLPLPFCGLLAIACDICVKTAISGRSAHDERVTR